MSSGHTQEDADTAGRKAFAFILARLARRDHTEKELARALGRAGLPEDAVAAALGRAKSEGLVNDLRLAQALARSAARTGKQGPRAVIAKLRRKGITAETAQAATKEEFAGSDEGPESLVRFAGRLLARARGKTQRERRIRVTRSLLGRGFALSAAKEAVRIAENALMTENSGNDADQ